MRAILLGLAAVLGVPAVIQAQTPTGHEGHAMTRAAARPAARVMSPQPAIGDITLIDHDGRQVRLADALTGDVPVMVNFIFTTCTTVCPIMSAGFARLQELLGNDSDDVKLISISIDPETDTVPALRAYAARQGAGANWRLFTGTAAASEAAQRAFNAFRGPRVNHLPTTFLRRAATTPWEEIPGLSSAQALLRALRGERGDAQR